MNFTPFPVLETERLVLREMNEQDEDDLFRLRADPLTHAITDSAPDETQEQTKAYIEKMREGIAQNRWMIWAMQHKASGRVIGTLGIWNIDEQKQTAELSNALSPDHQGKGYMQEALARAIEYVFLQMGLTALEAYTEEENLPSRNLLVRLGFAETNRVDDVSKNGARIYHMVVYRKTSALME